MQELDTFTAPKGHQSRHILFSPLDENVLFFSTSKGSVYSIDRKERVLTAIGHEHGADAFLATNLNGSLLFTSGSDSTIVAFDLQRHVKIWNITLAQGPWQVAFYDCWAYLTGTSGSYRLHASNGSVHDFQEHRRQGEIQDVGIIASGRFFFFESS